MVFITLGSGGNSYFDGYIATVNVTVAASSHWYSAGGITKSTFEYDFTQNNGVLTYIGFITKNFHISGSISSSFSTKNSILTFGVVKNGKIVNPASKNCYKSINSTSISSISTAAILPLSRWDTTSILFSSDKVGIATIRFLSLLVAEV